jgi:hypothetical protein
MTVLLLLPAALSFLLLAAHFLRAGSLLLVALSLGACVLLTTRRPWARRTLQVALVLSALEWLHALSTLVEQRQLGGLPYARLAVILGMVAGLAVTSAACLQARRVIERFCSHSGASPSPEPPVLGR